MRSEAFFEFLQTFTAIAKNSGNNTVHVLQLVLSLGLEQRQKIVKPLVDTLLDSAEELLKDELPRALRGANTDFEVPADEFDDIFPSPCGSGSSTMEIWRSSRASEKV